MMGLQAIKGDLSEALSRPDTIAITENGIKYDVDVRAAMLLSTTGGDDEMNGSS